MRRSTAFVLAALLAPAAAFAQQPLQSKVELSFDRFYPYDEVLAKLRELAAAYPELVELRTIGHTLQGREMVVAVVTAKKTGTELEKPAMWIDANVHGNEIQGTEIVLYSIAYLTKSYGAVEDLTRLLDECCFYFLPSQNPDGRSYWFEHANTSSSSRGNQRPIDDDDDGLFDEDPSNDLDGDGSITSMWRKSEDGDFVRDELDPERFRQAKEGEKGERWTRVGSEGIDDDGDGRINEDGPGGDDMNRNWPRDWQPEPIQNGSGPYPFSHPETLAIGEFFMAHPNIAAVQSYHNNGGMILRGPGASYLDGSYPRDDVAVYDTIGKTGEQLLPYFRYMIIYKDLYTVHGGFVNWTAEQLGIFSFTNELWPESKLFQREGGDADERDRLERDQLRFGQGHTKYKEFDHPTLGKVLIGGDTKWSSRVTPSFLLEEECHRNFAFTMFHAASMPKLKLARSAVKKLDGGLWSVVVQIENEKLIPTRSGIARDRKLGAPDVLTCAAPNGARVIASGPQQRFDSDFFDGNSIQPERVVLEAGVGSKAKRTLRFVVDGPEGAPLKFRYAAEKAKDLEFEVPLR